MDSSSSHAHAEAVRHQAELLEQARRDHQLRRQLLEQQQQQQEEELNVHVKEVAEELKPSDSFSNTVSTAVDDDWTLSDTGSLRSRKSLREQQQQQQLHQREASAYNRSKSASSGSSITTRDPDIRLQECPRSAPQRRISDRRRPRQAITTEIRSDHLNVHDEMDILRHCLSADAVVTNNNNNNNNNLQEGLHQCHSADDLNTAIQQEQHYMSTSMSSIPQSRASTSSTGRTAEAGTNQTTSNSNSHSRNRRFPRRVLSASETSSSSQNQTAEQDQHAPQAVARAASLSSTQQEPAMPRMIDQDIFGLWDILTQQERAGIAQQYGCRSIEDFEECMSIHQAQALHLSSVPTSPITTTTPTPTTTPAVGGDVSSVSEAPFIIEPRLPYRRKLSPNSDNNNNTTTTNASDSNNDSQHDTVTGASDYIPEEHSWVGAFSVRNVDALGNRLVPEAPSSPGRPTSIRRAPSIAASESTITQSIYTRQSVFSDEQTSHYNGNNHHNYADTDNNDNEDACVTEPDPLPYLPVARIVLPAEEQARRDQVNKEKHNKYKRKQLIYSFLAGVCCMLILAAAIIAAMVFTLDIFGMEDPENNLVLEETPNVSIASAPTASPTTSPTMAPTSVVLPLPIYTLQAMEMSRRSPQALAYQWLLQDLEVADNMELPLQRLMQRYALATIFFSTGGYGNWDRATGWLDHTLPECEWETVEDRGLFAPYRLCDPDTGEYESLVLSSNGLKGSIPPEISFLTSLKYLDMERNAELGVEPGLPTQIGVLTGLEELHLLYSYIPGRIPSELGHLTQLKVLDFEGNRFENTIPSELGRLSDLVDLKLQFNRLEGELPYQLSSMWFRRLMLFNVENNYLTGTIPLEFNAALASRKDVYGQISGEQDALVFQARFANNEFTGTVPIEFCSLQQRLRFDCDPDLLCGCDCTCSAT